MAKKQTKLSLGARIISGLTDAVENWSVATRDLLAVSQGMFAQFLGVSPATIRAWEHGTKEPSDMAKRFLDEIRRNPDY